MNWFCGNRIGIAAGISMLMATGYPVRAETQTKSYYYCDDPKGYFPIVQTCKIPWRPVPAISPSVAPVTAPVPNPARATKKPNSDTPRHPTAATPAAEAATSSAAVEPKSEASPNNPDSLENIRLLAEQGDAAAQNRLGFMYSRGIAVTQDSALAMSWYRKAADQGLAKAQTNLGIMYNIGQGVKADPLQAIVWFKKAAAQGNADALSSLLSLYSLGFGTPEELAQARVQYLIAAEAARAAEEQARGGPAYYLVTFAGDGIARKFPGFRAWAQFNPPSAREGCEKQKEFETKQFETKVSIQFECWTVEKYRLAYPAIARCNRTGAGCDQLPF